MQFSSVFCLLGVLRLVRSVHIMELRYNKPECGPYGFRCLNDKMFEICAEFKRSDDDFFNDEENLYPPIGSKAMCPDGRECDNDNPLYCTLDREQRHDHFQRMHRKCHAETTTTPCPEVDDENDEGEDDYEDSTQGAQDECQTEETCEQQTQPPIVFDESKSKSPQAAHAHAGSHNQKQGAEAPSYQIHSQGSGASSCNKHPGHKSNADMFTVFNVQEIHGSHDSSCSPCDNSQREETPPIVFYESQGPLNVSCDNSQQAETPMVLLNDSSFQGDQNCSCDNNSLETPPVVLYEFHPQGNDSCDSPKPCDDQKNYGMFLGNFIPDGASSNPLNSTNCGYRCNRAGNHPDLRDVKNNDVNSSGNGFVAPHKSCSQSEVFNPSLREDTPIENLHADSKRHAEPFKCVKCGDFPDPNNCRKYYHCERSHGGCQKFTMSHECCPEGTKFIKALQRCGCISPECGDDKKRRETSKEGERCCGGGGECEEPACPSKCIVVMSTPAPAPSSCGSCDDDDGYEDGPQMPDCEPDSDDDDGCGDQCGSPPSGDQCGGEVVVSPPVVCLPKTPKHFNCHGAGKFADPYNCTTFFVCHPKRAEGGYHTLRMSCPSGEMFDESQQKCVPHRTARELDYGSDSQHTL